LPALCEKVDNRRIPSGPAILTATNPQQARRPVSGQEFAPPPAILTVPPDAEAAGLLSHCPHCQHPLKFNPFCAAADDYATVVPLQLGTFPGANGDMETLAKLAAVAASNDQRPEPGESALGTALLAQGLEIVR